jgi:hypothetical protein
MNLLLIQADSGGDQPPYPFAVFSITSPKIAIGSQAAKQQNEQFEIAVSLTFKDDDLVENLNRAKRAESFFRSDTGRFFMWENGEIVVVATEGFGSRGDFLGIDYEQNVGFDLRLRVSDPFADDGEGQIEQIEFTRNEN